MNQTEAEFVRQHLRVWAKGLKFESEFEKNLLGTLPEHISIEKQEK